MAACTCGGRPGPCAVHLYLQIAPPAPLPPGPVACADCGVMNPIATLVRRGAKHNGFGGTFEDMVCADEYECARRKAHGVGG